jgi:hypothetical protein
MKAVGVRDVRVNRICGYSNQTFRILGSFWMLFARRTQPEQNTAGRKHDALEIPARHGGGACGWFRRMGGVVARLRGSGVIGEIEAGMQHGLALLWRAFDGSDNLRQPVWKPTAQSLSLRKPLEG